MNLFGFWVFVEICFVTLNTLIEQRGQRESDLFLNQCEPVVYFWIGRDRDRILEQHFLTFLGRHSMHNSVVLIQQYRVNTGKHLFKMLLQPRHILGVANYFF